MSRSRALQVAVTSKKAALSMRYHVPSSVSGPNRRAQANAATTNSVRAAQGVPHQADAHVASLPATDAAHADREGRVSISAGHRVQLPGARREPDRVLHGGHQADAWARAYAPSARAA